MCGIAALLRCGTCAADAHAWLSGPVWEPELRSALRRRGPDAFGERSAPVEDDRLVARLWSGVLHLRGVELFPQPAADEDGNLLCWNGEIFGSAIVQMDDPRRSDTQSLLLQLRAAGGSAPRILRVLASIRGPFACVYLHARSGTLFFARDPLGRRSLLLQLPPRGGRGSGGGDGGTDSGDDGGEAAASAATAGEGAATKHRGAAPCWGGMLLSSVAVGSPDGTARGEASVAEVVPAGLYRVRLVAPGRPTADDDDGQVRPADAVATDDDDNDATDADAAATTTGPGEVLPHPPVPQWARPHCSGGEVRCDLLPWPLESFVGGPLCPLPEFPLPLLRGAPLPSSTGSPTQAAVALELLARLSAAVGTRVTHVAGGGGQAGGRDGCTHGGGDCCGPHACELSSKPPAVCDFGPLVPALVVEADPCSLASTAPVSAALAHPLLRRSAPGTRSRCTAADGGGAGAPPLEAKSIGQEGEGQGEARVSPDERGVDVSGTQREAEGEAEALGRLPAWALHPSLHAALPPPPPPPPTAADAPSAAPCGAPSPLGGSTVAVLFSGGLDSMLLARLAHEHVQPSNGVIDLINVCFAGAGRAPSPDRLAAVAGWRELRALCPGRPWQLICVDEAYGPALARFPALRRLTAPRGTHMDLNIAAALWHAARGVGFVYVEREGERGEGGFALSCPGGGGVGPGGSSRGAGKPSAPGPAPQSRGGSRVLRYGGSGAAARPDGLFSLSVYDSRLRARRDDRSVGEANRDARRDDGGGGETGEGAAGSPPCAPLSEANGSPYAGPSAGPPDRGARGGGPSAGPPDRGALLRAAVGPEGLADALAGRGPPSPAVGKNSSAWGPPLPPLLQRVVAAYAAECAAANAGLAGGLGPGQRAFDAGASAGVPGAAETTAAAIAPSPSPLACLPVEEPSGGSHQCGGEEEAEGDPAPAGRARPHAPGSAGAVPHPPPPSLEQQRGAAAAPRRLQCTGELGPLERCTASGSAKCPRRMCRTCCVLLAEGDAGGGGGVSSGGGGGGPPARRERCGVHGSGSGGDGDRGAGGKGQPPLLETTRMAAAAVAAAGGVAPGAATLPTPLAPAAPLPSSRLGQQGAPSGSAGGASAPPSVALPLAAGSPPRTGHPQPPPRLVRVLVRSSSRVLLTGVGADEQLGGYGRHRTAFSATSDAPAAAGPARVGDGGWARLREELRLDCGRLWYRNLGRDDRVLSDVGREVRAPYLDEAVVALLRWQLPLPLLLDLTLPHGVGDKRALRDAGALAGLGGSARLVKRAIHFGSRIAKASNAASFGSNRAANLAGGGALIWDCGGGGGDAPSV